MELLKQPVELEMDSEAEAFVVHHTEEQFECIGIAEL